MKIVLPILHFAFMAAQVHGARVGFQLNRKFRKKAEDCIRAEAPTAVAESWPSKA